MAHNFHFPTALPTRFLPFLGDTTNTVYISKAGTNSGTGTSNNPLPILPQALAHDTRTLKIFGTGQYRFVTDPVANNYNYEDWILVGDGRVVIKGDGGVCFQCYQKFALYNLEIRDYGFIMKNVNQSNRINLLQCLFRNGRFDGIKSQTNTDTNVITDCVFIGCLIDDVYVAPTAADGLLTIHHNLFINTNGVASNIVSANFNYCYFDATSIWSWSSNWLPRNCNIRGPLIINSTQYASLAAAAAVYPQLLTMGNINQDPRFNNALREDFTLRLDSPHLATGIGPSHLRYAQVFYVASSAQIGQVCTPNNTWLVNSADASIINFLSLTGFSWSAQNSLYITENTNSVFVASYRTAPLQIAASAQLITYLPCLTGLNFDTSTPVLETNFDSNQPELLNNNVPSRENFVSGDSGRNPHRLTIGMRWSTRQAPNNNTPADWITGSDFLPFEINAEPQWNQATGRGNGDPLFDSSTANVQSVRALWVQFDYTARNNHFDR